MNIETTNTLEILMIGNSVTEIEETVYIESIVIHSDKWQVSFDGNEYKVANDFGEVWDYYMTRSDAEQHAELLNTDLRRE